MSNDFTKDSSKIVSLYSDLNKLIQEKYSEDPKFFTKAIISPLTSIDFNELKDSLPKTKKAAPKTAISKLKRAHNNERLTLVLGAGISKPFGIPTWGSLLQRLLLKTLKGSPKKTNVLSRVFTEIFNPSPLIAGRYLQEELFDPEDEFKFEKEVRRVLYETLNKDVDSPIMNEIIQLCIAPGNKPNLDGIITYNYDDIVETMIKKKGVEVPFQSVHGQAVDPEIKSLLIYHVHGYLPQRGNLGEHNRITLGEYVYHEQYSNIYSWNNIVQINKFRDSTCLFIGTSLSDPNIRRLLDISRSQKKASKYHYIFKRRSDKDWVKKVLENILNNNPDVLSEKTKADLSLNEIVDNLVEVQNRFEEIDSESLGVKTVWIDDYDKEITEMLRKLNN